MIHIQNMWSLQIPFLKISAQPVSLINFPGQKVAGSIPGYVIGAFHWHNPSGRTMAMGSTQTHREMSTRNISWSVKAAGA